jgi:DNA-binding protein HU-beta
MIRKELIEQIAIRCGVAWSDAEKFLNTFTRIIYEELKADGVVLISGFGKFQVSHRKARIGVNPRTRKPIELPELNTPKFVAGQEFKRAVKLRK